MKKTLLNLAVLGALSVSAQAFAAGALSALSDAPAGSAYINCFNTNRTVADPRNNFGQNPGAVTNGACEITGLANDSTSPKTGYALVASASRVVPTVTGGAGNIGSVTERVWRKPAATAPATPTDMCIFGAKVALISADHDAGTAGTQLFEVNDLVRAGFSTSGSVNVGYFLGAANASPVYRVGRTYTSVQHRALKWGNATDRKVNGTNYVDLPTIGGVNTLDFNGEATGIDGVTTATTTAAKQQAAVYSRFVDFTTDVNFSDTDGGELNPVSPMTYVEAACNSTAPAGWVQSNVIRLRQTGQELATFKEISVSGYAPPGAVVTP